MFLCCGTNALFSFHGFHTGNIMFYVSKNVWTELCRLSIKTTIVLKVITDSDSSCTNLSGAWNIQEKKLDDVLNQHQLSTALEKKYS